MISRVVGEEMKVWNSKNKQQWLITNNDKAFELVLALEAMSV
jgi:hypothetical protein